MVDLAAVRMSRLAELLQAEPIIHEPVQKPKAKVLEPAHQTECPLQVPIVDSQATDSRVQKAYDTYMEAYLSGQLESGHLNHLVNRLVDILKSKIARVLSKRSSVTDEDARVTTTTMTNEDGFTCVICRSVWSEPITVPCGHTYCRSCLHEQLSSRCPQCDTKYGPVSELKTNILLAKLAEKCYPAEVKAAKLQKQQYKFCDTQISTCEATCHGQTTKRVSIHHMPSLGDPTTTVNVSRKRHQEVLENAERAIKLKPRWPKGYYRKGVALSALGRHQEAVVAHLQCLALDPNMIAAKTGLAKVLRTITSPSPPTNARQVAPQALLCSSQLARLLSQDTPPNNAALSKCQLDRCRMPPMHMTNAVTSPLRNVNQQLSRKRCYANLSESEDSTMNGLGGKQPRSELVSIPRGDELLSKEDLECSLCLRLLYNPVTTPCGHVFCRNCLYRCLDHNITCPLCKGSLAQYLAERQESVTESVAKLVETHFSDELSRRKQQHENDLKECAVRSDDDDDDSIQEIPIFICTLAYPTVPCPLHVYEPRYRLMIRRCVESGSSQFGMCACLGQSEENFSDYGCTLDIRSVRYLADGRSVIDTVGSRRFRVIERSMKDGYHVARVQFMRDDDVDDCEQAKLRKLQACVYSEASAWLTSLPQQTQGRIAQHFGPLPTCPVAAPRDGPTWLWWLTAVLPLDRRIQLSLVAKTSLVDRLMTVRRILAAMRCEKRLF